jgi:ribosomal protein L37AE/L43A
MQIICNKCGSPVSTITEGKFIRWYCGKCAQVVQGEGGECNEEDINITADIS